MESESLRPLAEQAGGFFLALLTVLVPVILIL